MGLNSILNLRSGKIEGFPQKTRINLVNVSNTYWTVVCRYSIINGCIYRSLNSLFIADDSKCY